MTWPKPHTGSFNIAHSLWAQASPSCEEKGKIILKESAFALQPLTYVLNSITLREMIIKMQFNDCSFYVNEISDCKESINCV